MYRVHVYNYVDYSGFFSAENPMLVLMWAIAALLGPCRSGNAHIFKE